jgi:diamine N-acetyltransferase
MKNTIQNDTSLHIRYATAADNTLLAEIGAETFFDTFAADNTPENMAAYLADTYSPAIQARELADPAAKFMIIESEGEAAGYARIKFGNAPTVIVGERPMEISRLYARKGWIGKGVGARLMEECLNQAERSNCDVVWLDVWSRNHRAIAFYSKWGFIEVGTQVFQLGDDAQHDLLMARAVNLGSA